MILMAAAMAVIITIDDIFVTILLPLMRKARLTKRVPNTICEKYSSSVMLPRKLMMREFMPENRLFISNTVPSMVGIPMR